MVNKYNILKITLSMVILFHGFCCMSDSYVQVYKPFSNECPSNTIIQKRTKSVNITYNKASYSTPTGQGYKVFSNFFSENKNHGYNSYNGSVTSNNNYYKPSNNKTNNSYQQLNSYNASSINIKTKKNTTITEKTSNYNSYYEIDEERPDAIVMTKDVKYKYSSFEAFLYVITGSGTIAESGALVTGDDYKEYKDNPDYRDYIDNGGKLPYDDYIEQFGAPLDDYPWIFMLFLLVSYATYKKRGLKIK